LRLGDPTRVDEGALPAADRPDGQNAAAFVHAYLKEQILDLVLEPGTVITEMDVAKAVRVSRTPIHEALLRLHEERLVELLPRRGALVPWVTARQVRELYEVRLLLESRAVEVICDEEIPVANSLMQTCDEQEELDRAGASPAKLIRVDRKFHSILIDAAGNTVMGMVNDSLGDHNQRTGVLSFSLDPHRCERAVAQHREIAESLAVFDVGGAKEGIERHLVAGGRELERLLRH
jgi:DNA-binding GntR family transcriptional regulator